RCRRSRRRWACRWGRSTVRFGVSKAFKKGRIAEGSIRLIEPRRSSAFLRGRSRGFSERQDLHELDMDLDDEGRPRSVLGLALRPASKCKPRAQLKLGGVARLDDDPDGGEAEREPAANP